MKKHMKGNLMHFLRDEEGLTAVEYAVAGAMVSAVLVGAFGLLGDQLVVIINSMTEAFD